MSIINNKGYKPIKFKTIYSKLEKKAGLGDYLDDLKLILDFAGVFLGNASGATIGMVISALAEKTVVIDAGKRLLEKVKNLQEPSYNDRIDKMQISYALIYYTAFFDAMDDTMPSEIRDRIKLISSEQRQIFNTTSKSTDKAHNDEYGILFPNICFDLNAINSYLSELYNELTNGVKKFVEHLAFTDEADDKEMAAYRKFIEDLPKCALGTFHNQFFSLCADFNEFYIYTSIGVDKTIEAKLDDNYRNLINTAVRLEQSVEDNSTGLADLKDLILDLPQQHNKEEMKRTAENLRKFYQRSITKPLIDSDIEGEPLVFPPIEDAFIPQAYKLLKYMDKRLLGIRNTWTSIEEQQDMTAFWAKYIVDIDSLDNILLILGEPGGGKSLLTKVVSARLSSQASVVIRIPLREHDVENGIESIICERIELDGDTSDSITKFKKFAEQFPHNAITLIFDGFDEVQQATGRVYRQFLVKLRKFQQECKENERPVRIVVTSRQTLIDMADVPFGTTVMKLLEFNDDRRNAFIKIWNKYNHEVLNNANLNDFALTKGNREIDQLSSQPLLLTMLAIYDADFEHGKNALVWEEKNGERLDRTGLYDKLLRRFIRRELRKGKTEKETSCYDELIEEEQVKKVDNEMKKLGIAALGMFVREKLSIKIEELESDFEIAQILERPSRKGDSSLLRDAAAFLGSFFFICDPRSKKNNDEQAGPENDYNASFEFLHKTFYEFLIADILLDSLIDAVYYLYDTKKSRRGEERYSKELSNPDNLNPLYFPSFSGACLCTEPEIIKMAIEWKDRKIEAIFGDDCPEEKNEIISKILGDIFTKHIEFIKNGSYKELEVIDSRSLILDRPYPQSCAVYIMNLLTARIFIDKECRVDAEIWSYISNYIKLNLPLSHKKASVEDGHHKQSLQIDPSEYLLLSFMSIFDINMAERDNQRQVVFSMRKETIEFEQRGLLNAKIEIFDFLQDDISHSIYALHDVNTDFDEKCYHRNYLIKKGMDLQIEDLTARMRKIIASILDISNYRVNTLYTRRDYEELFNDEIYVILKKTESIMREYGESIISIENSFYYDFILFMNNLISELQSKKCQLNDYILVKVLHCWSFVEYFKVKDYSRIKVLEITKQLVMLIANIQDDERHHLRIRRKHEVDEAIYRILRDIIEQGDGSNYTLYEVKIMIEILNVIGESMGKIDRDMLPHFLGSMRRYGWLEIEKVTSSAQTSLPLMRLLNHEYSAASHLPINKMDILSKIQFNLHRNRFRDVDKFPELLREGLRQGEFLWVRECLECILNYPQEFGSKFTISTYEDLEYIAKIVGLSKPFSSLYEFVDYNKEINFLTDFERLFRNDEVVCVESLIRVLESDFLYKKPMQCYECFYFSLRHFRRYAIKSLKIAVNLLLTVKRIDLDMIKTAQDKEQLDYPNIFVECMKSCFNIALAEGNGVDSSHLFRLVEGLDMTYLYPLRSYFEANLEFIYNYDERLASCIMQKLNT